MEQIIIAGYIPFTNIQITFGGFAVVVCVILASWFFWSLDIRLKHPEQPMLPTISPDF